MSEANQLILTEGAAKGLLIGPARPQALWKNGRSRRGATARFVAKGVSDPTCPGRSGYTGSCFRAGHRCPAASSPDWRCHSPARRSVSHVLVRNPAVQPQVEITSRPSPTARLRGSTAPRHQPGCETPIGRLAEQHHHPIRKTIGVALSLLRKVEPKSTTQRRQRLGGVRFPLRQRGRDYHTQRSQPRR
jgi:hypothetical protein